MPTNRKHNWANRHGKEFATLEECLLDAVKDIAKEGKTEGVFVNIHHARCPGPKKCKCRVFRVPVADILHMGAGNVVQKLAPFVIL